MKMWDSQQTYPTIRWLDHLVSDFTDYTAMDSFAIDDALTQSVGDHLSPPTVRLWGHPNTVVLGTPDTRLPYINQAVQMLAKNKYNVIVRNSGGLAVVLDEGILNISLILPGAKKLSINNGYEIMVEFIKQMLGGLTTRIKAYEIVGSYCPGDYDLSINGIKFAGISQRRIKNGVAVQIYLDILGDSQNRAKLIRSFYDTGINKENTTFSYPMVDYNKMGSLTNLLATPLSINKIKDRAKATLSLACDDLTISTHLTKSEQSIYESRYKMMEKRNEHVKAALKI